MPYVLGVCVWMMVCPTTQWVDWSADVFAASGGCKRSPVWCRDMPPLCRVRVVERLKAQHKQTRKQQQQHVLYYLLRACFSPQISDQVKGPGEFKHITNRRKRN